MMSLDDFAIRQPKSNLVVYIIVSVFFFLIGVAVLIGEYDSGIIGQNDSDALERGLIKLLAISPFLLLGPFLIVMWHRWKIEVRGNRISVTSYFGKERTFTFDDIKDVEYGIRYLPKGGGDAEYIEVYLGNKKVLDVSSYYPDFKMLAERLRMLGLIGDTATKTERVLKEERKKKFKEEQ